MKKNIVAVAMMFSLGMLLFSSLSYARPWTGCRGSGGWGMSGAYGRLYDPQTVETISGEILSLDQITPYKGMSYGVHMVVKTDKGTLSVHLGPAWYLDNQDVKLEPKDKVTITGSRITFDGKPAIIAAEIKKGADILKLRDENGFPVWSGWRKY